MSPNISYRHRSFKATSYNTVKPSPPPQIAVSPRSNLQFPEAILSQRTVPSYTAEINCSSRVLFSSVLKSSTKSRFQRNTPVYRILLKHLKTSLHHLPIKQVYRTPYPATHTMRPPTDSPTSPSHSTTPTSPKTETPTTQRPKTHKYLKIVVKFISEMKRGNRKKLDKEVKAEEEAMANALALQGGNDALVAYQAQGSQSLTVLEPWDSRDLGDPK